MAPLPSKNYDSTIDSHEDRLQKVESTLQDVVANVAEVSVKQDYAKEALDEHREDLAHRIDHGFSDLKKVHEKMYSRLDSHAQSIDSLGDRLAPVEAAVNEYKEIRKTRKGVVNKILMGAVLAASGVVGVKVVEWILGS